MHAALFAEASYKLSVGETPLSLVPFPASAADAMGAAVAAMDPWATYGFPAERITSYLAAESSPARRFLVEFDGAHAGALGVQPDWLRGPYLHFLALLPEFQGRGIGAAIVAWFEAEARAANERNLWLIASQINTGAIRFYERHGFSRVAEIEDMSFDGRTEILMRKFLAGT